MANLVKLFSAGFLALTIVGCSSTPKNEEADSAQNAELMDKAVVETSIADSGDALSSSELTAEQKKLMSMVVHFDFDRSEVKAEFYDVIRAQANFLQNNSSAKVTVSGHCDERGTREYNLALGERRANAVKNALIANGVAADRIDVISYGEDSPVDAAHNEAAWSKNRRAEFQY